MKISLELCVAFVACVSFVNAQCAGKADLIILIPGSDSVPGHEFFPFERFLINLISFFQIDADNANVGLILYGREPVAISWPQPMKTHKQTNTRITLMCQRATYAEQMRGGNDVASAINLMRQMFSNTSGNTGQPHREGVKQIGVVFTYDGVEPELREVVINATEAAKAEGIVLYGVGKGNPGPEFSSIGSDYCKSFSMGRFIDGLPSVLAFLGSSICSEMDPYVNATEGNCFPQLYQSKEAEPVTCDRQSYLFPDPENCAYYYHCLFRRPVQERCPIDMLFDPIAKSCNYKDYVSCYTDIKCHKQNGLFAHPTDCSKYVNCFDFRPYVQSCPPGLWFDVSVGGCDTASNVACSNSV
ncbi:collagen alpha-1(XIV) chain-like [Dreissena polymorpha]|uniref:Uncharacterized protein n=1 Tax=Dreissena polymorpha TaxID=45954 RepID=A0A9D4MY47_DREPO|nr:collagen alpha-1(XIV) chain-like [Dreissena polymorpha]KAH3884483.1 hypothetical protein DPMN_008463 [Dreissena polymorpha]